MKCIQHMESGKVKRVSNIIAALAVASGIWAYCPKWMWKEAARKLAWTGAK